VGIFNVPIQTIFSRSVLAVMKRRVESESSVKLIYARGDHYPVPEDAVTLQTLIDVSAEPPVLAIGATRSEADAENAIQTFEYLGPLTRTQAADTRLWTTLTHTTFWDYCRRRWPMGRKGSAHILDHWFERRGAGLGALRRNAVSRLWWAANLTVAPWDQDPQLLHLKSSDRYRFTRILLSQAQIFQDVLEREFGSNHRLRILLLNALDRHLREVPNRDNLSKDSSTQLLLLLKNRHLEAMPVTEAERVIDNLVDRIASRQTSGTKVA
jgi:hypothetical protein